MVFSLKKMFSGGLPAVGQATGNFKRVKAPNTTGGFSRMLNKAQLWAVTGSDITATIGVFVRVGQFSIPAQQRIHVGTGVSGGNPEEIGHLHFDIMDDTATNSAQEPGIVRIGYTNANETLTAIVYEGRTEELSATSTSGLITRSNEILQPETSPEMKGYPAILAQEDSKIIVDFKADATDIIVETGIGTGANNIWKLPITVYQ